MRSGQGHRRRYPDFVFGDLCRLPHFFDDSGQTFQPHDYRHALGHFRVNLQARHCHGPEPITVPTSPGGPTHRPRQGEPDGGCRYGRDGSHDVLSADSSGHLSVGRFRIHRRDTHQRLSVYARSLRSFERRGLIFIRVSREVTISNNHIHDSSHWTPSHLSIRAAKSVWHPGYPWY